MNGKEGTTSYSTLAKGIPRHSHWPGIPTPKYPFYICHPSPSPTTPWRYPNPAVLLRQQFSVDQHANTCSPPPLFRQTVHRAKKNDSEVRCIEIVHQLLNDVTYVPFDFEPSRPPPFLHLPSPSPPGFQAPVDQPPPLAPLIFLPFLYFRWERRGSANAIPESVYATGR